MIVSFHLEAMVEPIKIAYPRHFMLKWPHLLLISIMTMFPRFSHWILELLHLQIFFSFSILMRLLERYAFDIKQHLYINIRI